MTLHKPILNILTHLVDDDDDFRLILKNALVKHPEIEYKIHTSIDSLFESIESDKNISVIDYNFKTEDINGLQLMKEITQKNPNSYVIMMSSQTDVNIVTDFYDAKGFRYINKYHPSCTSKLIDSIKEAKDTIQRHLDYHFELIEKFNKTEETFKDARNTLGNNYMGDS